MSRDQRHRPRWLWATVQIHSTPPVLENNSTMPHFLQTWGPSSLSGKPWHNHWYQLFVPCGFQSIRQFVNDGGNRGKRSVQLYMVLTIDLHLVMLPY